MGSKGTCSLGGSKGGSLTDASGNFFLCGYRSLIYTQEYGLKKLR